MKKIILFVFFLVTWTQYVARQLPANLSLSQVCEITTESGSVQFDTLKEAKEFVERRKGDALKSDFHISRVEEIK